MQRRFEIIIIGGSYAGLQAGMTLGRALRQVLIIDSGLPCNRQTPHSHNFLTRDGEEPARLAAIARDQLGAYATVSLKRGKAIAGRKTDNGFEITTEAGDNYSAKRLLIATGIKDQFPELKGITECWGISVIHCPYCHGYEVRHQPTGILANGVAAYEYIKIINHWTGGLTLFTNGPSTLTETQRQKLNEKQVKMVSTPIEEIIHSKGYLSALQLSDGTQYPIKALYFKPPFVQHSDIPARLGVEFTDNGYIRVSEFQQTTVPGVYAAGDCMHMMRSVGTAVSTGMMAGAFMNKDLIEAAF